MNKIFFILAFFATINWAAAQDDQKHRFVLWDEPYDYALGVSYGYSPVSHSTVGIDWKCRWFGVSVEFGPGVHPIKVNEAESVQYFMENNNYSTHADNFRVQGFARNYFMLSLNAHLRYFSVGIGWGFTDWSRLIEADIDAENSGFHALVSSRMVPQFVFLRPYVEGHIPIFNNMLVLSPKVGLGFDVYLDSVKIPRINHGLYVGLALLKTF